MAHPELPGTHPGMMTVLFKGPESAECGYRSALDLGYPQSDINLVMSDEARRRFLSSRRGMDAELRAKAAEDTQGSSKLAKELGGPVGGTLGTLAPALAAIGTLALIPGVAIAGPVAVALTAAGVVGLAGGLVGALSDWGIPPEHVRQFETGIRAGGIILGVKPRSDEDARELVERWKACGSQLIHS
jgi:hypothetical protein